MPIIHEEKNHAEEFREALQEDSSWAWSYHCNIAVQIMDSMGVGHEEANRAAADLMNLLFKIDVTQFDEWRIFEWTR